MLLRSNFSSFPHYFLYIFLTSGVKLHIHLLNVVVQFNIFLTLSTLTSRGTDISKYFSESLGIRDNESRLYIDKRTQSAVRLCECMPIRSVSLWKGSREGYTFRGVNGQNRFEFILKRDLVDPCFWRRKQTRGLKSCLMYKMVDG